MAGALYAMADIFYTKYQNSRRNLLSSGRNRSILVLSQGNIKTSSLCHNLGHRDLDHLPIQVEKC